MSFESWLRTEGGVAHQVDVTRAGFSRHVVDAAIAAGAEAVVVVSTTALFGDPGGEVDESSAYAPGNEYERLKADAEKWALSRAATSGATRVAVVNSACVYGPQGRMFTEMPARFLRDGVFCWIEDGRGLINYVYVRNLVDALILAAAREDAHGNRFIACDGTTTWREFFTGLLGPDLAGVRSFTRAELEELASQHTPGWRELGKAVVGNPELWRVIRGNPRLSRLKSMARSALPTFSDRVRTSRDRAPRPAANGSHAAPPPPPWMAELYGPIATRLRSDKARRILEWTPEIDLDAGLGMSREWLQQIGLLPGHG